MFHNIGGNVARRPAQHGFTAEKRGLGLVNGVEESEQVSEEQRSQV